MTSQPGEADVDSPTVLVVEDEPELREVVCAVLEDEGYNVVSASDGRQAVDMVCADPPSLILLDMGLPILSGEEVAAALQERLDRVPPILVMSAAGTVAERARRIGATSYIAKPFDLDDLTEAVQALFTSRSR